MAMHKMKLQELFDAMDLNSVCVTRPPERLSVLSLKTYGSYISELLVLLATSDEAIALSCAEKIGGPLHESIKKAVPPLFANDVTEELLKCVDLTYRTYRDTPYRKTFDQVTPVIVAAILHPSVTRIHLFKDKYHFEFTDDFYKYVPHMIVDALHSLNDLIQLRFPLRSIRYEKSLWVDMVFPENLQEFSSGVCNDTILLTLSKSCKRLKVLDIRQSLVTCNCVPFIIRFRYLEELDISDTYLHEDSVKSILEGFIRNDTKQYLKSLVCCGLFSVSEVSSGGDYPFRPALRLKSFGCGSYKFSGFESFDFSCLSLLSDHFPNLTSLNLFNFNNESCNMLKLLKNLTKLTLKLGFEYHPTDFVLNCPELVYLDLRQIRVHELKILLENCGSLRCLHVTIFEYKYSPHVQDQELFEEWSLPVNKTVQCLCLRYNGRPTFTEHIISKFVNVKYLCITDSQGECMSVPLFQNLFLRNILYHLERFVIIWDLCDFKSIEIKFLNKRSLEAVLRSTHIFDSSVCKETHHIIQN
ncbi:uncharacterized protein [Periplaneta americana]